MSEIVYRIGWLLEQVLASVPLGTNLSLFWLLLALLSGRFLLSRGAVVAALADLGLPREAVCRAQAALAYGRFTLAALLLAWQQQVEREGRFQVHCYASGALLCRFSPGGL